jgi:hypothetical protein
VGGGDGVRRVLREAYRLLTCYSGMIVQKTLTASPAKTYLLRKQGSPAPIRPACFVALAVVSHCVNVHDGMDKAKKDSAVEKLIVCMVSGPIDNNFADKVVFIADCFRSVWEFLDDNGGDGCVAAELLPDF